MALSNADLIVLSVLTYERPMHGYELFKILQQRHVHLWAQVSKPQIYYSIRKLSEQGLLRPVNDETESLGPEKITYGVEERALPLIADRLSEKSWVQREPPGPFTTWSALAMLSTPETISTQIADRGRFLRGEIQSSRETLELLSEQETGDARVASLLIRLSIKRAEMELSMLEELEHVLLAAAVQ
ncbi:MAG: helix-turn-helix transcriptional regulator [Pseudomonadota bacterium]